MIYIYLGELFRLSLNYFFYNLVKVLNTILNIKIRKQIKKKN